MKLNLKKIISENPFLLAPMDDVTDIAFRELCEEFGASYTCSELISVEALIRDKVNKSRYEKGNLKINCVQLFGSNPDSFIKAAKKLEGIADIIDVNFGCPSPSVNANNSGAILLNDPKNVFNIINYLVKNINIPITAKIRLGYKKLNHIKIAKEIERAGASLITIHGRTAEQKYSGKANWEAIKEIHNKIKIPVIGNGNIKSTEDIDKYLYSHCDGLMIGRAAIGNPLIFKEFNQYFHKKENKLLKKISQNKKEKNEKIKKEENKKKKEIKKKIFLEYIEKLKKYEFSKIEIKIQRQSIWFMKGIENTKELRKKIMETKDINKIIKLIKEF